MKLFGIPSGGSVAAVAILAAAGSANAQFLTGITKPVFGVNQPTAYFTDLAAGTNQFLFDIENDLSIPASAPGFGGLAGDDANRRFFASVRNGPQDDIYVFNYNDLLNPTLLFTTRDATGAGQAIDGLAYDSSRNALYGVGRLDDTLLSIDLSTGTATPVFDFSTQIGGAFDWDVSAIDYDADSDLVYIVNEDSSAEPSRAIWSFDPSNPTSDLTLVAELPSFVTDVDGLGAGGGQLFLVTDNASSNNGRHTVYDLATGLFTQPIDSPYPAPAGSPIAPNPSAAGAYTPNLPAPGSLALLALGGLGATRRRR
ncbi:MAG: hypothetical protein ACF8SC_12135 [Phycisphaerales bacterium JB037]